jgi:hypothetical protein
LVKSSSNFCNFRLHSSSRFSSRFNSFWLSICNSNTLLHIKQSSNCA